METSKQTQAACEMMGKRQKRQKRLRLTWHGSLPKVLTTDDTDEHWVSHFQPQVTRIYADGGISWGQRILVFIYGHLR